MADQFIALPLTHLMPDPHQPRRELENDSAGVTQSHTLQGLADSIAQVGVLQPIRVRALLATETASGGAQYMIVSGQRRYEAAKKLRLKTIPCLVVDAIPDPSQTLVTQVSENLQRKAMTASELASAVQSLVQANNTQEQVAHRLGIQASQVTILLNLLKLTGPTKTAFEQGLIESPRAAYDLSSMSSGEQEQLIEQARKKGRVVTQRDVRAHKVLLAKNLAQGHHRFETPPLSRSEYKELAESLNDGVSDAYDPDSDRTSVFGEEWSEIEASLRGKPANATTAESEPSDGEPVHIRVPTFVVGLKGAEHLFRLLGHDAINLSGDPQALGMELAKCLSLVESQLDGESDAPK